MTAVPSLAVVIVNFKSAHWVRGCVQSLPAGSPVDRVVIVNNSAWDRRDAEILSSVCQQDARVTIHDLSENVGFGAAVNAGVRVAQKTGAAVVWILNPDVVVQPAATERLLARLSPVHSAILSPLIVTTIDGRECVSYAGGSVDTRTGRVEHTNYGAALDTAPGESVQVTFMTGAAMMMAVETFEKLGGFREDLFLYWEDVDLSLRAASAGVALVVVPDARVWHAQGGTAERKSDKFYYYNQRNRLIVCHEVLGRGALGLLVGRGFPETMRLLLRPIRRERDHRLRKTARSVRGLFAGVRAVRQTQRVTR